MVSFFLSRQPILTPDRPTDRPTEGRPGAVRPGEEEGNRRRRSDQLFLFPPPSFPEAGRGGGTRDLRSLWGKGARTRREGDGARFGGTVFGPWASTVLSPLLLFSLAAHPGLPPFFLPQCFVEDPLPCPPPRNDVVKIRGFGEFPAFPDTVWVSRPSPCNRTRKRSLAFQMQKSEMERERIGETLYWEKRGHAARTQKDPTHRKRQDKKVGMGDIQPRSLAGRSVWRRAHWLLVKSRGKRP